MITLWLTMSARAQVDEWPCRANDKLWLQLEASELSPEIEQVDPNRTVFAAASSLLGPSRATEPKDPDADGFTEAHGLWACTYGASRLVDGDEHTAWAEGAPGTGLGEVVVVPLPTPAPVEIWSGFGKSPELYRQNSRPRRVEVLVLGQGAYLAAQYDAWMGVPVLGRHEVELEDVDGWQPLPLPQWGRPPAGWAPGATPPNPADQRPTYLAIRILSVYQGEKYQDTCISEVRSAR